MFEEHVGIALGELGADLRLPGRGGLLQQDNIRVGDRPERGVIPSESEVDVVRRDLERRDLLGHARRLPDLIRCAAKRREGERSERASEEQR